MKVSEKAEEFFTTVFLTDEEMTKAYEALTEKERTEVTWLIFNQIPLTSL